MRDWPTVKVLFTRFRLFGDSLVSKGRGAERELRMADGLVEAENWKNSDVTTGILEEGSIGVGTLPMA